MSDFSHFCMIVLISANIDRQKFATAVVYKRYHASDLIGRIRHESGSQVVPMNYFGRCAITAGVLFTAALAVLLCSLRPALAQDLSKIYEPSILKKDGKRLETAVRKIFHIGIKPSLTADERKKFDRVEFRFPYPKNDDYFLNFFAYAQDGRSVVVMPVLSLKILEDLATAYAWLYHNGYSLSTIDTYFTMLQHRPRREFTNGIYPPLLHALAIPKTALKDPKVDKLSLSFRNEAYAFILLHELGHILFKHRGYDEITKAQARADETQSDRFALDVLEKSRTPPMGAVLFFQAQFYSMPHRGEFKSDDAWQDYLHKKATHPLTGKRLKDMVRYITGPLADRRPNERMIWQFIGQGLTKIIKVLEDADLQKCVTLVAEKAPLDILLPRKQIAKVQMEKYCAELR